MLRAFRNLGRAIGLARTLACFDALFVLDRLQLPVPRSMVALVTGRPGSAGKGLRPGQRLAAALQAMGPSFVKLGQSLSTRADLVGTELAADLAELRDRMAPFPAAEARRVIAEQLDQSIEEAFATFEDVPVAAASIAQVHFATLPGGIEVAVKVLRPGIEDLFARDLDLFEWLAEMLEMLRPDLHRLRPTEVVRTIRAAVDAELDLRMEAAAATEMAEFFAGDPTFQVADVDWRLTQRRVMTAARVHGTPVGDPAALLAAGHNPERIVRNLIAAFMKQAFVFGFFHADLHHGNLFVDQDDNLIAVDFGITGRLNPETRAYVAEMLLGMLTGDFRRAADAHFRAGYVPRTQSMDTFAQALRSIASPVLDRPAREISIARLLGQMFEVTETFAMRTQPQLLLLQKTLVVVEGLCREVAPDADLWAIARDCLRESSNLPRAAVIAREAVESSMAALRRIPDLMQKAELAAGTFTPDGLKLHPDSEAALTRRKRGTSPRQLIIYAVVVVIALVFFLRMYR